MQMTPFVITVLVIALVVYDLIVVTFFGVSRSVSRFINVVWLKSPVVCFGCGFLCGHFTGYMNPPTTEEMNMIPVVVSLVSSNYFWELTYVRY